jgi:Protein of unknown function (DUF664)
MIPAHADPAGDAHADPAGDQDLPDRQFGWWDMFVHPDQDPRSDGGFRGGRATLAGFLRDQRLTLELKCAGLDAEAMARRSVPPSTLSLPDPEVVARRGRHGGPRSRSPSGSPPGRRGGAYSSTGAPSSSDRRVVPSFAPSCSSCR